MTPKSLRVVTYISPTEDPLLYAELVALDKGDRSARARTLLRSGQSGRTDSQSNGAATIIDSRCWIMCQVRSSSERSSIGET